MSNRCKTLLRDHSVPEVRLKAYPKHTQSQPYLRPSPLEDLKDLPTTNGLDLTMIIMSKMLDLTTVCLWQKYMWISAETDLDKCDVYLTLMKSGHFSAACPKQGYKIIMRIPDECRPMYLTSDSMRDTTYAEDEKDSGEKLHAGN